MQGFSVLRDWLVGLKKTVKIHFLMCCRTAGNWNISLKSGVAAGGLAQGAMAQIGASAVGGRTERLAAGGHAQCAKNQTAGWGKAALGREPVGVVRKGGACYNGSVSPDHSLEGAVTDEAQVVGAAGGYEGGLGVAHKISSTTAACSSSLLRKCERLIRVPSCHTRMGVFLGC